MRHIGSVSRESIPKPAVPTIVSKDGCKVDLSGSDVFACKSAVKSDGFYQP